MSKRQQVTFDFDGRQYHMMASHYKRNGEFFMKATWYDYDRWTGNRYPRSITLWWLSIGDLRVFFDKEHNFEDFVQALGQFLYERLQVTVENSM